MNTKVNEGKLISGKEALIALANGQEIEARHKQTGMGWSNAMTLNLFSFKSSMFEFRLKPRTIKLELEIPAPFEPKGGETAYFLSTSNSCGYTYTDEFKGYGFDSLIQFGAWRTEEEIRQVIAALKIAFKPQ